MITKANWRNHIGMLVIGIGAVIILHCVYFLLEYHVNTTKDLRDWDRASNLYSIGRENFSAFEKEKFSKFYAKVSEEASRLPRRPHQRIVFGFLLINLGLIIRNKSDSKNSPNGKDPKLEDQCSTPDPKNNTTINYWD